MHGALSGNPTATQTPQHEQRQTLPRFSDVLQLTGNANARARQERLCDELAMLVHQNVQMRYEKLETLTLRLQVCVCFGGAPSLTAVLRGGS